MEGAGFWILVILAAIISVGVTLAIYDDPRCLIVECTLVKDIKE
jgi:hypothetical protein